MHNYSLASPTYIRVSVRLRIARSRFAIHFGALSASARASTPKRARARAKGTRRDDSTGKRVALIVWLPRRSAHAPQESFPATLHKHYGAHALAEESESDDVLRRADEVSKPARATVLYTYVCIEGGRSTTMHIRSRHLLPRARRRERVPTPLFPCSHLHE